MRSSVKNKIIWTIALPIIFGNLAQTLIALTDTALWDGSVLSLWELR